ncbi:MAG: lip2 2 [Gemmatimonadetes bacterium]|nr:lip2 2 [Gemmatimonadota bacterium]
MLLMPVSLMFRALLCHAVTYTPPGAPAYEADVCVPSATPQRDVAIVMIHGGGGVTGSRGAMRAWQERLAREGYVTLSVDYHLMTADDPAPVYPLPERNVKTAVQWVRQHARELGVSPERIVVMGNSAGGRLAGQLLTTPDDPFFAGADRWPATSDHVNGLIGFYGAYDGSQLQPEHYYGGARRGRDSGLRTSRDSIAMLAWQHANSLAQASRATGPAILFHGTADGLSEVCFSVEFDAALRKAGKRSELHLVPGGVHGFDRRGARNGGLTAQGENAARQLVAWLAVQFPAATR